jgi:hypothetical protein
VTVQLLPTPGDTWSGVLWQGLFPVLIGGVIAGLVAWWVAHYTVARTQKGDVDRARLVASQAAALVLQKATRDAMHAMTPALHLARMSDLAEVVANWREECLLQRPVICDPEVRARIDEYRRLLERVVEYGVGAVSDPRFYRRPTPGTQVIGEELKEWGRGVADVIRPPGQHLSDVMAAHRADETIPPALPDPVIHEPTPPAGAGVDRLLPPDAVRCTMSTEVAEIAEPLRCVLIRQHDGAHRFG